MIRNDELRPARKNPTIRVESPIRLAAVELIGTCQWLYQASVRQRQDTRLGSEMEKSLTIRREKTVETPVDTGLRALGRIRVRANS